jgi:predicted PurR-regulated permease PerM
MKRLNKRGVWDNLSTMTVGIITFIVIAVVGALILTNFTTSFPKTQTGCPALYELNGTANCFLASNHSQPTVATQLVLDGNVSSSVTYGQTGVGNLVSWTPVIVVVAIGAVLIAMVVGYFVRKRT